jgi:acyl-CoA thioesterase-1
LTKNIVSRWFFVACLALLPGLGWAAGNSILIVGDSLSAAHNIPVRSGWVSLLQQRLEREVRDPPTVVNASISGETSAGALARLPDLLLRHSPKVVVIELGGNDALCGLQLPQLRGNLEQMIAGSQRAGAKVLLLGIDVPPNYGPAYRARLRSVYTDLAAEHHTAVVPFFLEGIPLQPALMQADGIHPTAAAQPKILDNVWPRLRPLL